MLKSSRHRQHEKLLDIQREEIEARGLDEASQAIMLQRWEERREQKASLHVLAFS